MDDTKDRPADASAMIAMAIMETVAIKSETGTTYNLGLALAAMSKAVGLLTGALPPDERRHWLSLFSKQMREDADAYAAHIAANPTGAPSSIILN